MAREQKLREVFVLAINPAEASLGHDVDVIGMESSTQPIGHLSGLEWVPVTRHQAGPTEPVSHSADMSDIRGQDHVKRALDVDRRTGERWRANASVLLGKMRREGGSRRERR